MSGERGHCAALPVAVLVAMMVVACGGGAGATGTNAPKPGGIAPAPHYDARRMESTARFHVQDARGRALLLTSFATWCTECRAELPRVQRLYERHRPEGLMVVGVSVDDGSDEASRDFARRLGVTFDLVHDEDHNYQAAFRTLGVPSSALVDRAGMLVKVWQGGFDVASRDTEALIEHAEGRSPS
jgi:peroxiredoxin